MFHRKKNKVNLKETFYVNMVKLGRAVCKWLKIGKHGMRIRVLGFVVRFILGTNSDFVPHVVWTSGKGWFFQGLSLPEIWRLAALWVVEHSIRWCLWVTNRVFMAHSWHITHLSCFASPSVPAGLALAIVFNLSGPQVSMPWNWDFGETT